MTDGNTETVERVARVISEQCYIHSEGCWQPDICQSIDMATAALSAMPLPCIVGSFDGEL